MRRFLAESSIGQKLLAGFAAVLAVLALFAAGAYHWQREGAQAQTLYLDRVVPLSERTLDLQRSLVQVAVALRSQLLSPDVARGRAVEASAGEAAQALESLAAAPRDPDSEAAFASLKLAVEAYLRDARAAASLRNAAEADALEQPLADARAAAVQELHALLALQREKARRAIQAMERSRERVNVVLVASFLATALLLVALGLAIAASIRTPARRLMAVARAVEQGAWTQVRELIPRASGSARGPRNELARIGMAFGATADAVERREARLRCEALVAQAACSSLDKAAIADQALKAMAEATGAVVGVIYGCDPSHARLEPIASRALPGPAEPIAFGSGLPGRAATERRVVVERGIPHESLRLRLGIDEAVPRFVAAVPIAVREETLGVAVLAGLRDFDAWALELLESTCRLLALGLHNVRTHEKLRAQSEELQAQSEELQAQSEELQAQGEELQAQNEELQQRTAELAEADGNKNQFLGLLAHELRNPLGAIANSLFVLERGARLDQRDARSVEVIRRQMRYLTRLIDDLLDITRISRGKLQLRKERVDLVELVREGVQDARPSAQRAGLVVEAHLPPGPIYAHGDRTRLAQVLGNLVSNAVKFSEPGGRIDVFLEREPGGASARLRVRDQGIGIDPASGARLFEPFVQADAGLARTNGGLGLGLALARALVQLHDGTIEVASEGHGRGSEFAVTLPLGEAPEPTGPEATPNRVARPRRILLIEDNVDAADTLRMALELEGHEVHVCSSGVAGVEKALSTSPELILCDLGIPQMDGFEVARRLRGHPSLQRTLLVALSGYAMAEDRQRSAEAGFHRHLAKPLEMRALLELIATLEEPAPVEPATA